MKAFTRVLVLAAAWIAGSNVASASMIGYTSTVGPTDLYPYTLTLNQFDPLLGTLTGVTLYFHVSMQVTTFNVTNNAGTTDTYDLAAATNLVKNFSNTATAADIFTGETIQLFDTGLGTALGNCTDNPGTTILPNNGCSSLTLGPHASTNYAPFSVANTDSNYVNAVGSTLTTGTGLLGTFGVVRPGTVIGNYVGTGTFNLAGTRLSTVTWSIDNINETLAMASNATITAEVDYTYDPPNVPEPATLIMVGSALIGLGMLGRHLQRARAKARHA